MGFPLLVKAVLGGGGKGMKLATSAADLEVHGTRRTKYSNYLPLRLFPGLYVPWQAM